MEVYSKFNVGDMILFYFREGDVFDFTLVPAAMADRMAARRTEIKDSVAARSICRTLNFVFPACQLESMVQYRIAGSVGAAQHTPGSSMRNPACTENLKFISQTLDGDTVRSVFAGERDLQLLHNVKMIPGKNIIEVDLEIINSGSAPVLLEMAQSFSLGMLSPFQTDDAPGKYFIHRMQSHWSAECRPERISAEAAGLEMSWQAAGMRSLRFGQRSTMPVKDYYPFAAVEDAGAGVIWGAQISAPGAWQMEVSRFCDMLNISGGMVDREFGAWSKKLLPGESFRTMPGVISCVKGDVQELCSRLSSWQDDPHAAADVQAPPFFNEYCTTWGDPTAEKISGAVSTVKGMPFKYFILDDGWFKARNIPGSGCVGDWDLYENNYPGGFAEFLDSIRQAGFIPGIWFEFEVAFDNSLVVKNHPEYLITLDDYPVSAGNRRFLDFRKAEVRKYLGEKVIDFLAKYNIGYIKVDYNACISCGCDGDDSPAENQRCHIEQVVAFFSEIRRRLPELVIEVCSSGGHRISPAWVKFADVVSSSDAHEGLDIPVIAANVQQMISFKKSQIWAVVRPDDTAKRLGYSLSAAMIGRMCISGDVDKLDASQFALVDQAVKLYSKCAPAVLDGVSRVTRNISEVWGNPAGYQFVERRGKDIAYLVFHTFSGDFDRIKWQMPEQLQGWKLVESFTSGALKYEQLADGSLLFEQPDEFEGAVFVFTAG